MLDNDVEWVIISVALYKSKLNDIWQNKYTLTAEQKQFWAKGLKQTAKRQPNSGTETFSDLIKQNCTAHHLSCPNCVLHVSKKVYWAAKYRKILKYIL